MGRIVGKLKMGEGFRNIFPVSLLILTILIICGCSRDSKGPAERLTAYCIRECVIETAAAEICDTKCRCAVKKLAGDVSAKELAVLVKEITENGSRENVYMQRFKTEFEDCPGIK